MDCSAVRCFQDGGWASGYAYALQMVVWYISSRETERGTVTPFQPHRLMQVLAARTSPGRSKEQIESQTCPKNTGVEKEFVTKSALKRDRERVPKTPRL